MCKALCTCSFKLMVYLASFILFVIGLSLTVAGGAIMSGNENWQDLIDDGSSWGAGAIAIGVFVLLTSMLGCCGASNQKKRYLVPYSFILLVLAVSAAALAGVVIKFSDGVSDAKDGNWTGLSGNAKTAADDLEKAYKKAWDHAQTAVDDDSDWHWFYSWESDNCDAALATDDEDTAWAACRDPLADEVHKFAEPVAATSTTVAVVIFVLFIGCVYLMCVRKEHKKGAAPLLQDQYYAIPPEGGQPVQGQQGSQFV